MKPYYEHAGITIYHGDCREVLPTLAQVDLIVTDPPYGVKWRSNYRQERFESIHGDDSVEAALEGVRLGLRALRDGRHVYAFGKFDFSGLHVSSPVELIWDKGAMTTGNLSIPWGKQHEPIQFFVYQSSTAHRDSGKGALSARLRRGSVLQVPRVNGNGKDEHPTEKPVLLLRMLIEASSCIGETVLDPFSGVGTVLQAAKEETRRAIGIEIEERYCEIAAKRLSQEVMDFA